MLLGFSANIKLSLSLGCWRLTYTYTRTRRSELAFRKKMPKMLSVVLFAAVLASAAGLNAPVQAAARPSARPALQSCVVRSSHLTLCEYDFRPDPPWQRDGIILLTWVGVETLLRSAATGVKVKLGFDLMQLNAAMGGSLLVSILWVVAAAATGVVGESRYDRQRVLLTWLLAAPAAALLRLVIYDGFPFVTPTFVLTDMAATLALMLGLRQAEEQGYL